MNNNNSSSGGSDNNKGNAKEGEEVNLIVKKMSKFSCKKFNKGKQKDNNLNKNNNNDDKYSSEYPSSEQAREANKLTASNIEATNQEEKAMNNKQKRRTSSGGSDKYSSSPSSTSSAFYENEESEEDTSQLLSENSSTNSQSGRSSANKTPDQSIGDEIVDVESAQNLLNQNEAIYKFIDEVRLKFLSIIEEEQEEEILDELYDQIDLDELKKPLPSIKQQEQSLTYRFISRFLNYKKISSLIEEEVEVEEHNDSEREDEIQQCAEKLRELLKFRCHYQLNNVLVEQFSREFYIINGAFLFGRDKQNLPVFYMRARIHRRWSKSLDQTFKRYLAWQLNTLTKSEHNNNVTSSSPSNDQSNQKISKTHDYKDGSFGICFDCLDIGYSCVDMEFLRFIVHLLIDYYPTYCRYALCVDLPWLFRSVWKLVKTWLPEEAQNTVHLITGKQLIEFIDEDQIPNSMKFNDLKASEKPIENKHIMPKNWESIKHIEELDLGISANEIKQFKAHVEKLRKEYEQLGAL